MAVPDFPAPIEASRTLGGRYRLVRSIARGGMAEVWEGHDEVLSRPVAVKVLQAHLAEDGIFLERFRREAVTAARLAHPGVVSTFDTGIDDGTAYIVMELVRGCTLRQLLTDHGPLEPWLAVAIARQIADAMSSAHRAGLVHRDIKPANVLLTDDDWAGLRVKVTDFGIAKAGTGLGGDLTRTGTVLGTPKYLSPEQIKGNEPDARADLYSLGVVLFEMLTGAPPFVGPTDMATALAHLNDRAPRVSSRSRAVSPALDRLVADLLAKDPERRVPSASILRQRLDALDLSPPLTGSSDRGGSRRRHRGAPIPPTARLPEMAAGASPPGASPPGASRTGASPTGASPPGASPPGASPVWPSSTSGAAALTAVLAAGGGMDRSDGSTGLPKAERAPSARREGSTTDQLASIGKRPALSRRRGPGLIVFGLIVAGVVVAAILFVGRGPHVPAGQVAGAGQPGSARPIAAVTSFMLRGTPDDPQGLRYTFDGNPATAWHTDQYQNATFGNLYPGLGLAIQLSGPATLHHLVVTSATSGWAAETYVSSTAVPSGQPVSAWGQPTATKTGIAGSATFSLGGRHGQWVLLWLTNLGPGLQASINELLVN